ncbi:MAG: LTA synthase family protein [Shewanella sp.]
MVLYTLALYSLIQVGLASSFDVGVWPGVWVKDAIIQLVFAALLFVLCRNFLAWVMVYTSFTLVLQVSNALKLMILGSPIMPDDFSIVGNMFQLFNDWRYWALWAALLIPFGGLMVAIAWQRQRTWLLLALLVGAGFFYVNQSSSLQAWFDVHVGDRVWDQPGNYKDRGLLLHLTVEGSRVIARGQTKVTQEQVLAAKTSIFPAQALASAASISDKRNVYVLLLESFWDPMALGNVGFNQDPFDPRFRDLWQATANSTVLAPVFGGYTANSEFEALCGFPVTQNAVFFEGWLRNEVPCLPRYLSDAGYQTTASHPNHAGFWNRVNAYNRVGFDKYWSINDFSQDDMNREFMSDVSLFNQVWDKTAANRDNGQATLNYIVTIFGHLDYPLNERRPVVISATGANEMAVKYANQMYYKTREIMDFIATVQAQDPQALIVMFGDHLPFLGPNYDGYTQTGVISANKADFSPEMFATSLRTPLIVIDGINGPQQWGEIALYELPRRILALLGDTQQNLLTVLKSPQAATVRPLAGISIVQPPAGDKMLCAQQSQTPECQVFNEWLEQALIISQDIFSGAQWSLAPTQKD